MSGFEDALLGLIGLAVAGVILAGCVLGWIAFFQVRKLRQEWELRERVGPLPSAVETVLTQPETPTPPAPVPVAPEPESRAPETVPVSAAAPVTVAEPVNRPPVGTPVNLPPRVRGDWEKRLLENWMGLVGLAVVLLGLGFLAVYGAAVLNPFGRFLLIVAAAAASLAGGMALVKYQPRWTRWGYWLQSFGAAVFLIACLGSGGIPGVAWVTNPLAGLGLLLFGIAVNLTLGSRRRRQPYLTLHVVLSLVALAVAEPSPLIVLALWATAFLGLALSWFQRWSYHRVVTVVTAQAILVAAYWRAAPDPTLTWLALGASASLAILVHIASYRRVETAWSRPSFVTHVLNALAAAVPCALWSPRLSVVTAVVLTAVFAGLVLLSLRSKSSGASWLYRTDRVLALAVGGIVLLLNPVSTPPLALGAVFVILIAVMAWTARLEGDALLTRIGLIMLTVGLGVLSFLSLFQYCADTSKWFWQTVTCYIAAALAAWFAAAERDKTPWHAVLDVLLPPAFLLPLFTLWVGDGSPLPGVSPGWLFIAPAVGLAVLARMRNSTALGWSMVGSVAFAVFCNGMSWLGQGLAGQPWPTLTWGLGTTLAAAVTVFASPTKTTRFLTAFLVALTSAALLVWLSLDPIHPVYAMAALSALLVVVLVIDLNRLHPSLATASAGAIVVVLAVVRLTWAFQAPVGWIALGCDLVAAGLLAAAALSRRTGPAWFWEACLIWLAWAVWFDLPPQTLALGISVVAVASLAAGRALSRPRLDWYSAFVFLLAAVLCLFTSDLVLEGFALGTLVVYLVVDSLWKSLDAPGWQTTLRPVRRYVLVFVQAAVLALCLPAFFDSRVLTFGWSLEAALVFFLAVVWKDGIFKNVALAGLGVCLIRLIFVDLSGSDVLTKAITFLSVGGLMVGMNILYLWSKNRREKKQP